MSVSSNSGIIIVMKSPTHINQTLPMHRIILLSATVTIAIGAVFVIMRLPDEFLRQQLDTQRLTDAHTVEMAIEAYLVEQVNAFTITGQSSSSIAP